MIPPRFQFTIKGLLWATFWLAAAISAFCYPRSWCKWVDRNWDWPWGYFANPATTAPLIVVVCLCAAVGAIVGRHRLGLAVGAIVFVGWLTWVVVLLLCNQWHTEPLSV